MHRSYIVAIDKIESYTTDLIEIDHQGTPHRPHVPPRSRTDPAVITSLSSPPQFPTLASSTTCPANIPA
ncbi:hypothetical protein ACQ86N_22470 [Puia sp. P3]|uniref:hypothetical protein n=1 Tax=Puia sp. P3 TaxID=3423952 RepID=UPI003D67A14B